MARMHSGAHGRHGSKKPVAPVKPVWIKYKPKEIEMLIVKLAKEGLGSAEIGLRLRDVYGVPSTRMMISKSISKILADKKLLPEVPDDIRALIAKLVQIRKHLLANKHDESAKRSVVLTESKIKRLAKYNKRVGKLPVGWSY